MQIEKISYHKTFNLGNYSNEKIGIDIVVGPEENPTEVFAEAKRQVEKSHKFFTDQPTYEKAQRIIHSPDDFTGREVKQAQEIITAFESNYPEFIRAFQPASRQLNESTHENFNEDDN